VRAPPLCQSPVPGEQAQISDLIADPKTDPSQNFRSDCPQYIDWDYDEDVLPALGASPKTKEVEVQWSIKWVNFSTTVEASSTENAIDLALQEYKEKGAEAFTIRAGNEDDVDGLDGIFRAGRKWVRVTDEYGNLDDACFRFDDEDEDEDKE
jgi:hypothetical protein